MNEHENKIPAPTVYLIPSTLEIGSAYTIPAYVLDAVKQCQVFFVENERTARRFLKSLWKEMPIDNYEWEVIEKTEAAMKQRFTNKLRAGKNIGIISEAGCPGVADPGQLLVGVAHALGVSVKPLVGPSSILLAVMASGMNGQQFHFLGYLPIEAKERILMIKQIESASARTRCTQVFIETPYRNNQLLELLVRTCQPATLLSIAADLTSDQEYIRTKTIVEWRKELPDLHKRPAIFSLLNER